MQTKLLLATCLCLLAAQLQAATPTSLKEAYGRDFEIGVAIPAQGFGDAEIKLLATQFTNVTSENCLKPAQLHRTEARFDFSQGDALVALAQQHHLKVNGHTLVWHQACPDWFFADQGNPASRELVLKRMRDHIAGVVGHYRGQIASWDVVNEALSNKPGEYLRDSNWLKTAGAGFVLEAFRAAEKADPDVELYYNDYSIEYPEKRAKALRLVRELKSAGARIDGIGIQGHWELGKIPFNEIRDSIAAFQAEGLKVMITELDLGVVPRRYRGADLAQREAGGGDPYAAGCPPQVLRQQADEYAKLFRLFCEQADKITRVTFWGLHDGRTWLNHRPRERSDYPLLWGRDLRPKPAYDAVIAVAAEQ